MPLNSPTTTNDNISFGPGRLFLGAAGDTPTVDVGAISEDGITMEAVSTKRTITQGNPKIPQVIFTQEQSLTVNLSSIEWDFTSLLYALGAGVTTVSGSEETFAFGGEPAVTEVALHIEHQMAISGNTMNVYVWRAASESGFEIPFTHDEHTFEFTWSALQATTNWAGVALPSGEQLVLFERLL